MWKQPMIYQFLFELQVSFLHSRFTVLGEEFFRPRVKIKIKSICRII